MGSAHNHHGTVTTLADGVQVDVSTERDWKPRHPEERTILLGVESRDFDVRLRFDLIRARHLVQKLQHAIEEMEELPEVVPENRRR